MALKKKKPAFQEHAGHAVMVERIDPQVVDTFRGATPRVKLLDWVSLSGSIKAMVANAIVACAPRKEFRILLGSMCGDGDVIITTSAHEKLMRSKVPSVLVAVSNNSFGIGYVRWWEALDGEALKLPATFQIHGIAFASSLTGKFSAVPGKGQNYLTKVAFSNFTSTPNEEALAKALNKKGKINDKE